MKSFMSEGMEHVQRVLLVDGVCVLVPGPATRHHHHHGPAKLSLQESTVYLRWLDTVTDMEYNLHQS